MVDICIYTDANSRDWCVNIIQILEIVMYANTYSRDWYDCTQIHILEIGMYPGTDSRDQYVRRYILRRLVCTQIHILEIGMIVRKYIF